MALPTSKSKISDNIHKASFLFYGEPKSGKSTFTSEFGDEQHKVLFFATENGHKFLEVYEWTTANGNKPSNWEDFRTCLKEFYGAKDFSYLAIDTVSNLISWCESYVFKKHGVTDESQGKFGNIFREIHREFSSVINMLGQINKGIIFISHVNLKKEKEGIIYPDLPVKYENLFNGLVDYILYFYTDNSNNRLIRSKGTDRIIAGDRSGKLPEIMPMNANKVRDFINNKTQGA